MPPRATYRQAVTPGGCAMWLPQTAEYALRAMAALAVEPPGTALRAVELAERTAVPAAYLAKILRRLVVAGLISGRRGRGGGFTLSRPPHEVRVAEILEAVDLSTEPDHCAFGWPACNDAAPCPLHPLWGELRGHLTTWAERTRLDDVLGVGGLEPRPRRRG